MAGSQTALLLSLPSPRIVSVSCVLCGSPDHTSYDHRMHVGMQVLCAVSEEFGPHDCLGVVGGSVRRLPDGQKVPQIGWNQLRYTNGASAHPIVASIPDESNFYFVHSYYCELADEAIIAGVTDYGISFPSALLRDNLAAVQFHPEKSGRWGLQLLTNFIAWAGRQ